MLVGSRPRTSSERVTACRVAHPPFVGFIARLRSGRFPGSPTGDPPRWGALENASERRQKTAKVLAAIRNGRVHRERSLSWRCSLPAGGLLP